MNIQGNIGRRLLTCVAVTFSLLAVPASCVYAEDSDVQEHHWDEGVITTDATCVTEGIMTYTCTDEGCGETKTESIGRDPDNHTGGRVIVGAKDATCAEGWTGDTVCADCGKVILEGTVVSAVVGHTLVTDPGVEATCTEDGLTEGSHCSVCGEIITEQETIPATGHQVETDEEVPATKNATGLTEGSHCKVCNEVLTEQKVIPVISADLQHGVVWTDMTISEPIDYEGDLYVEKGCTLTLDASVTVEGNMYVFGTVRVNSGMNVTGTLNALHFNSLFSAGEYDYGYVYVAGGGTLKAKTLNIENDYLDTAIPANVHTLYWDSVDGTETDKYELKCSVCNMDFGTAYKNSDGFYYMNDSDNSTQHQVYDEEGTLIRVEGCEAANYESVDAAYHKVSCKCHSVLSEMKEHNEVSDPAVEATYTTSGLTEGSHCADCGMILTEQQTVEKKVLAKPVISKTSCTADGAKLVWDKVPGAVKYRVYYKFTGNTWRESGDVTSTSCIIKPLTSGSTCYFTVEAYAEDGTGSGYDTTGKPVTYLAVPNVKLSNGKTGITLKWNAVTGATSYRIYRKIPGGKFTRLKSVSSKTLSFTDKDVKSKNGTTYIYTVKAMKGSASGTYKEKSICRLTEVSISSLNNTKGRKMTLKWSKNSKVTGYQIQYADNSSFSKAKTVTVKGASKVSATISSLTKKKIYYVRIRVYKGSYSSAWSSVKKIKITK